jgi:UDP-N-acetyl-D-mannosaminuronic acid transferase (WecB/TagA/CpsF family)
MPGMAGADWVSALATVADAGVAFSVAGSRKAVAKKAVAAAQTRMTGLIMMFSSN